TKGDIAFTKAQLSNERWPLFAKQIADPADPAEHSPKAVDKFMDYFDDYVVRVKGVKPQFHAKNSVELIDFTTDEGRKFYAEAVDRFMKKKAKLEAMADLGRISAGQRQIGILVAMLQYRIAAEANPDRIAYLAEHMYHSVQEGYASVCAV